MRTLAGNCPSRLRTRVPRIFVAVTTRRRDVAANGPVLALDGCVLSRVKQTLARQGISPSRHIELWRLGIRKRQHEDFGRAEAAEALAHCWVLRLKSVRKRSCRTPDHHLLELADRPGRDQILRAL